MMLIPNPIPAIPLLILDVEQERDKTVREDKVAVRKGNSEASDILTGVVAAWRQSCFYHGDTTCAPIKNG